MERVRISSYARQRSAMGGTSSPMHVRGGGHVRSGSAGPSNFRRPQQARAAAQRLARVMALQPAEDDDGSDTDRDHDDGDDDDDDDFYQPPSARVARRSRSPAVGRNLGDNSPSVRSASTGQLFMMAKPGPLIPAIKPLTRPLLTAQSPDPAIVNWRNKRLSVDLGNFNVRETTNPPRSASALQDEIDMLQEENENIVDKLRLVEKGGEEAEARSRELEKQVASLGEGVSLETPLLSRKEAALQQREAALRVATHTSDATNVEVTALRLEIEAARDEALSAAEHLQEVEYEIKSFKTMTQRMILTQEEMEEVILKRCWLARYWKLCLSHGFYPEIAEEKHEYWSSLAPLPFEVVISAGQKSKDDFSAEKPDVGVKNTTPREFSDPAGEGNIEHMFLVEKGMRELALLKVEDAIAIAMAQHRRQNMVKNDQVISSPALSEFKIPFEGQNLVVEAFELNPEESEDVLFKQAWLIYFWRRAKNHAIEQDIAEERLKFWINQSSQSPTSLDAANVERGLLELKRLGIENQLWEASRRDILSDSLYTKP